MSEKGACKLPTIRYSGDNKTGTNWDRYRGPDQMLREENRKQELLDYFQLDPKGKIKKMSKGMKQKLGLVAKYVDDSSMVSLLSAPVRRSTIALTQGTVLVSGTLILTVYITALEWFSGEYYFPGQLELEQLLRVNAGLFCLHLCLGGICFLASCLFSETKYSLGVGAGLPILMYVFQMMANMGGKAETAKYFTVFTLFQPEELAAGEGSAVAGAMVLLALGVILYGAAVAVFTRKDLHI